MAPHLPILRNTSLALVAAAAIISAVYAQSTPWPATPLFIGISVPPNIVLSIDDSGSMDGEVLLPTNDGALWWHTGDESFVGRDQADSKTPGSINYNNLGNASDTWKKYVYLFPNGTGTGNRIYADSTHDHYAVPPYPQYAFLRSPVYNKAYYDPSITYTPWPRTYGQAFTDANPTSAASDPTRGGNAINLTQNLNSNTDNWKFRVQPGMKYTAGTTLNSHSGAVSIAIEYFPATYYLPTTPAPNAAYNSGKSNCSTPKPQDYKDFEADPRLALPPGVHALGPDGKCLTRYEIKPGATFPSGRTYSQEIQNFANWFTYYRKRHSATRGAILRVFDDIRGFYLSTFPFNNRQTLTFYAYPGTLTGSTPSGKSTLFNAIKDYVGNGGTPTRESLNHIGSQLARTSSSPLIHTCQRNYGIIFTDGFANNSTTVLVGNVDGNRGAPYADGYSNTLADIAMKYYDQLRSGGNVPKQNGCGLPGAPAWLDCNTEWHLNTYAVTLGTLGTVFGVTHTNRDDAYQNPPVWPEPNLARNPRMVDDLYHATINGRGEMLNATRTDEVEDRLRRVIDTILDLNASGGGVSVSAQRITTDTKVFYATFESGSWAGDVVAYPLTLTAVGSTPLWRAADMLPAPTARNIWTRSNNTTVTFTWSQLSNTDRTALGSEAILNYLRGVRSNEVQYGGTLRNRPAGNVLGDVAHSTPLYLRDNNTVFVGSNDGMLHAFDANTGVEHFAYIPSALIGRLKNLSSPSYVHEYFVDGEMAVSSRLDTNGKNILVAALGRGGKGLFALDVTNPSAFGASHVLWESFGSGDNDMGYILGRPVIARMNNGQLAVIVGNGYASASGTSALYIFRLSDGTLLKKFNTGATSGNGMATPAVWDEDKDGLVDYIYAGDLKGNVWRFDVTSSNPSQWDFKDKQGNTPKPFFVAKDGSGNVQPINAPMGIAVNNKAGSIGEGKRFLLFGTGSYFRSGDAADKLTQTWYGLIDDSTISGRSELTARSISANGFFDSKPVRTFSDVVTGDMNGKKGWYLDFTGGVGERITTQTIVIQSYGVTFALASSIIPSENPCEAGGRGYLNVIDPFTGARLSSGVLDINNNRDFSDDKLSGVFIGSVDLGVGMPATPSITNARVVVPGTTRINSVGLRLISVDLGRTNWREIVRD